MTIWYKKMEFLQRKRRTACFQTLPGQKLLKSKCSLIFIQSRTSPGNLRLSWFLPTVQPSKGMSWQMRGEMKSTDTLAGWQHTDLVNHRKKRLHCCTLFQLRIISFRDILSKKKENFDCRLNQFVTSVLTTYKAIEKKSFSIVCDTPETNIFWV